MARGFFLTLAAILLAAPAAAQHPPFTPAGPAARPDSAAAPVSEGRRGHWTASGQLAYSDVSGNRSLALLATSAGLKLEGGQSVEFATSAGVRYGKSDGEVVAESYRSDLKLRVAPRSAVSPFLAASGVRDLVRNVRIRLTASAGVEANLVRDTQRRVTLGLALLQDYESRLLPAGSTEQAKISLTRFNLVFNLSLPLREGVIVEHRSFLEPAANDLTNYLFTTENSLRVLLSRTVGLQTSWQFHRDNTPSPGVAFKNDRTLSVGILLQTK